MDGIRITKSLTIPTGELRFRFSRSGGPGGQHVNRRETRAELVFDVASSPSFGPRQRERALAKLGSRLEADGTLRIVVDAERSQARNREIAVERFRKVLADALRPDPPPRRASRPSRAAKERRLQDKRRRAQRKRERSKPPGD